MDWSSRFFSVSYSSSPCRSPHYCCFAIYSAVEPNPMIVPLRRTAVHARTELIRPCDSPVWFAITRRETGSYQRNTLVVLLWFVVVHTYGLSLAHPAAAAWLPCFFLVPHQGAQDTAIAGYDDFVPLLLGGVQVVTDQYDPFVYTRPMNVFSTRLLRVCVVCPQTLPGL